MVTEDIDLWFEDLSDPKLSEALRAVGAGYVPPFGFNPPMLAGTGSDPFDVVISMSGLGRFADELKHAIDLQVGPVPLKILSLDRILASKIAANRPKDQLVIPLLRNTLRTVQTREKRRRKTQANPRRGRSQ